VRLPGAARGIRPADPDLAPPLSVGHNHRARGPDSPRFLGGRTVIVNWILGAAGLFCATTSALLTFLYLRRSPTFAAQLNTPEARSEFQKYRMLLQVSVGLLAAWLVLDCLGVILL
jgi:hypothetical protein